MAKNNLRLPTRVHIMDLLHYYSRVAIIKKQNRSRCSLLTENMEKNKYFGGLDHADFKSNGNHISKTWLLTKMKPHPFYQHLTVHIFSSFIATSTLRCSKFSEWLCLGVRSLNTKL